MPGHSPPFRLKFSPELSHGKLWNRGRWEASPGWEPLRLPGASWSSTKGNSGESGGGIWLKVPGLVLLIVLFFFISIFLGVNILNKQRHCLLCLGAHVSSSVAWRVPALGTCPGRDPRPKRAEAAWELRAGLEGRREPQQTHWTMTTGSQPGLDTDTRDIHGPSSGAGFWFLWVGQSLV